ncbi:hypothetical protein [Flavobacterium sp. WC2509]|uniref:hypothetical protein n=1 Tax=Flavobacterium sp. WC2509 TaxID=3461406 RepID=UPI004044FA7F
MKVIYILILLFSFNNIYSQTVENYGNESFSLNSEEINAMENDLKMSTVHVKVITTCSINPKWCESETMAFGSTSLVKILDGKYKNQLLNISALCTETKYKDGDTYILKISPSPSFGVGLCNNNTYNTDRSLYIKEKRFPMLFGILE